MSVAVRSRVATRSRRTRTITFGVTVAAVAAAAGALSLAKPTGLSGADVFWSGALAAVVAFFGATARRWTWFLPAGAAAVFALDGWAVACAAIAIGVGFWSVVRDTRSRARGALVAGLGCIALLRAEPVGFHGLTAVLMVAAALPIVVSGYTHAGRRVRARTRRVALIIGTVFGLMFAGAALGIVSVQGDITDGWRAIDNGMRAARDTDDDTAAQELGLAARHLSSANATLSSWFVSPAQVLPFVGPNISAVESLARQAGNVAEVTSLAASEADVDSLRFVGGRLDPAAVAAMVDPLKRVKAALDSMSQSVDTAQSPWLVAPVADRIELLDHQIDDAMPDADMALGVIGMAPDLLGANGPKRYLVLFTTQSEARGRTGFPGNFAELVVDDGKLSMPRFGRISELEQGGIPGAQRTISAPVDYVARYDRFDVASTWRNLTMSPDFLSIAQVAAELYPQSGGQKVDGVLSVDPVGLAALLRYTGPVEVEGLDEPLTTDNAANFLLLNQYVEFDDENRARIDVLEEVARTTFDRLTTQDLPGPRALSDALDPVVDAGHIQFITFATDQQLLLYAFGVSGAMPPLSGHDSVVVTTANAGGNKIDTFLARAFDYAVQWDPETGQVTGKLAVTLTNNAPAQGLPDYVIGNAVGSPPGTNRSFVSIYSPLELDGARLDGQPAALQSELEVQRNVFSTFVSIRPGGAVTLELDLTGTVEPGRPYELVLAPEGTAQADQAQVSVEALGAASVVSDQAEVDGATATWSGPLDRTRTIGVTLAD
ncbi:MAG: DUF4012 domain-containing protein [Acidimicrobiales bacterium]